VRDIDQQLLRLREIEARIAFAECYVREQRETAQKLTRLGFATSLAHDLLRSMQDSLKILEQRRQDLLANMQAGSFEATVIPHAPLAHDPSPPP
jgi:hypothetical protein